jgi:26S proteasome regulatory subunit N1
MAYVGSGNTAVIDGIIAQAFGYEVIEEGKSAADDQESGSGVVVSENGRKEETTQAKSAVGEDRELEAISLLAMSLISMGEDVSVKMATRLLNSSMLTDSVVRKSIFPLCLSLLYASNPDVEVLDTLGRSINTGEPGSVINTIISLGIVGAGTNSARIQQIFEQQYVYHPKNTKVSFLLKICQGLIHLGKGTLSLSPYVCDKNVLLGKSIIGLVSLCTLFLDPENSPILGKYPFLFYLAVQSVSNKYVVCVSEEKKELEYEKINVRIGKPTNIVGMAGKPRKIASVQMHTSPLIVQSEERAEIYEDEGWVGLSDVIEDCVIVRKTK